MRAAPDDSLLRPVSETVDLASLDRRQLLNPNLDAGPWLVGCQIAERLGGEATTPQPST